MIYEPNQLIPVMTLQGVRYNVFVLIPRFWQYFSNFPQHAPLGSWSESSSLSSVTHSESSESRSSESRQRQSWDVSKLICSNRGHPFTNSKSSLSVMSESVSRSERQGALMLTVRKLLNGARTRLYVFFRVGLYP